MSKAFTKESDDLEAQAIPPRPSSKLSPGINNYVTPDGAERMRNEFEALAEKRAHLLQAREHPDAQWTLSVVDQRIRQLRQALQTAVVVPPPEQPETRVRFGARVQVRADHGETDWHRIVGVDEVDLDKGWVSFLSPIAKALQGRGVGERVLLKLPGGEQELEILRVEYSDPGGQIPP